jgi:hypothetical protein
MVIKGSLVNFVYTLSDDDSRVIESNKRGADDHLPWRAWSYTSTSKF